MIFRVREFRERQKMSQVELCEKAGISRTLLSDIENGKVVNTTVATLQKLAEILNCKVSDLFCPQCLSK